MAETAVGFAIDHLVPLLTNEASLLRGVHSQVLSIKQELEAIQCVLKDADMKADVEDERDSGGAAAGVKLWVKELREVAFQIDDVIDEYMMHVERHPGCGCGFIASLAKIGRSIIKLKPRHQIASRIQEIQKAVVEIKERSARYGFDSSINQGTTNSIPPPPNVSGYDPRKGSRYLQDDDVVGIESPKDELVGWLSNKQVSRRAVISVVGMGGLGKTTLARKVYDFVKKDFDCHAWITVSQSYHKEELLKNVLIQFCVGNKEPLPQGIDSMDEDALTEKIREYLLHKRYVVFYDDVWKNEFWGDIEHALLDNKNGGRIVITTRIKEVANFCKISSFVYVHELKPLDPKIAWELFCKRAFRFEVGGHCPSNLEYLSHKIVERCGGLPLAIVAIGGLLSTKYKTVDEWKKLHDSLSSELESNQYLTSITKILSLSYYDFPYHLKCCFLYFGMYPEDYSIKKSRLIRQWISEGFVKPRKEKILEEVAEEYLTELIDRNLVQISNSNIEWRKGKACRVHDLLHEIIRNKMKDLNFCHVLSGNESTFAGEVITRRLSIINGSWNVVQNYRSFQVRSILNFNSNDEILANFLSGTFTKNFKLLKVVDFEDGTLDHVHEDIGNLFHLRYLSIRNTKVKMLPSSIGKLVHLHEDIGNLFHLRYLSLRNTKVKTLPSSIGKLVNLETLDLRGSFIVEIPDGIKRLSKLRYLLVYRKTESYNADNPQYNPSNIIGMKVKQGIGCLEALQKLALVEGSEMGVDIIKELGKLTQLKKLGIHKLRSEDGRFLFGCIEKMSHLKSLFLSAVSEDDTFDSECLISSLPQSLQYLCLVAPLRKLPKSTTRLENLEILQIGWSKLEEDPVKTLKNLHNLVFLWILYDAYNGEQMKFEEGVFPKLKNLQILHLSGLKTLVIEEGALPNLEELSIGPCPKLNSVPTGFQHLKQLQFLMFHSIPIEFQRSLKPGGHHHHTVQHVPRVLIRYKCDDDDGQSFVSSRLF